MSVRTYNPSVRVGNWNEDLCLEEDLLKDFVHKKETGQLLVQKTHNLLETLLLPVKLSPLMDGLLRIGDHVMLHHTPSDSVLSAKLSPMEAHDATQLNTGCVITSAKYSSPCRRNVFVVGSNDERVPEGDVVCYGQHVTMTTLPEEGGELKLSSDRFTFANCSKHTRQQEVQLIDSYHYTCDWQFLCFDAKYRLETEGEPIKVTEPLYINHCATNQHLAVHTDYTSRTPFGREYEVTANTKFNIHKSEDVQNHFKIFDPNRLDNNN